MLKPLVLSLWLLAFMAYLFALATEVWEGAPYSVPYFVGAILLGIMHLTGTWYISKRYPKTDRAAWVCFGLTGGAVGIAAGLRLVAMVGA